MQKIIVFFLAVFIVLTTNTIAQTSSRKRLSFDEGWMFHFGNAANPEKDFNYSIANIYAKSAAETSTAIDTGFKDSTWQKVTVPHDWVVGLPFVYSDNFDVMAHGYKPVGGLFPQNSIGWYRKNFSPDRNDSGQRFTIQFDGIFRDSKVWINGIYLGNNKFAHASVHSGVIISDLDEEYYKKYF